MIITRNRSQSLFLCVHSQVPKVDLACTVCRYLILGTHQIPLEAFCDALRYMQVSLFTCYTLSMTSVYILI